jgi:hypothetical protein
MRTTFLVTIIAIILLGGCKKSAGPTNFSFYSAGAINNNYYAPVLVEGNASFQYQNTIAPPYIQLTMTGPGNQTAAISWYNIDSLAAEGQLTPGTYSIPAHTNYPPTVSAVYNAPYGAATYLNGAGTGGTVTITKNTGHGGVMSGSFSFTALNQSFPYDTVYITQGNFSNVPLP